ncbi:hypothetical protein [Ponticaulis sp.]|uniref:hypothetical protein n=1 Tax=Ponticaulis sp. TaxID=2020902 RepID=UPI000B6CDA54|nr:hypothetical protein [Ponticaulis sp.]MAJ09370.1 DUF4062 domain-containing protein [Ponticaulis sp.]RPG18722.1 MAG: DUF4062 domain-containing protein [Hyphomonadaceae bacterium TMED125]HBH90397.1 DUF4062 domain-containing protein [Hyphomonadaceae bacterium]HBJ91396.1 DUF4062 domain-containing protein [Hyphomonadaceae bacterium]|tara:strand:- start:36900 stop:37751 length:852 start_codon:yes stop_codon:yes gene_type:complete
MAFSATALKVMIATPSDVKVERNHVREILHDWNDLNSETAKTVLLPVGWDSHAYPDLAGRAQEHINRTVLADCDLLVGVFWTRLGSSTGVEVSGTVEEIKTHFSQKKPTMVYFSSEPVALDSVESSQYEALKKFKKWCQDNGLYHAYENSTEFRDAFRKHLQLIITKNEYLSSQIQSVEETFALPELLPSQIGVQISDDAKEMLAEVAKDRNGVLTCLRHLGGQDIQSGGRSFVSSNDRREIARWEAAMEQLERNDFIRDRGYKREIFEITNEGYKLADSLGI